MRFALLAIIALLLATSAFAADIDGKWTGSIATPGGEFPISFTLQADDKSLMGTATGPDGSEILIKDGEIDGVNISFSVTRDFAGMPFTITYKGVLAADQLMGNADVMGQPREFIVKKEPGKLMNLAHIHIVLNHIPSFGSIAALLLLVAAIFIKNDALKKFSFLVLVLIALSALPTYITGAESQRAVRNRPAVSRPMIQVHQNAAMVTIVLMTFAGTFAWFGLWEIRRFGRARAVTTTGTLATTGASVIAILSTASVGGKISHPEVRHVLDSGVTEAAGWREPLELLVSDRAWAWPAAETLHFIGMALLFGVSLLLLMRMLGAVKSIPFSGIHRLLPLGVIGFGINVLTGMLFFVAGPGNYLGKSSFHIKMLCILLASAPLLYFTLFDAPWETGSDKNASATSKIAAICIFGLLVAVVIYGRYLPFLS